MESLVTCRSGAIVEGSCLPREGVSRNTAVRDDSAVEIMKNVMLSWKSRLLVEEI